MSKKNIVIIGLVILLATFVWALWGPKEKYIEEISRKIEAQRERPDLFFKGVTISETVEGIKYWEIHALASKVNQTIGVTTLKRIEGVFFEDEKPVLGIVAPAALWYMEKREILIKEPVGYSIEADKNEAKTQGLKELLKFIKSVISGKLTYPAPGKTGYWFKAKSMRWGLETKQLLCEEGIKLNKGTMNVSADKLVADVGMKKIMITGEPKIVIE